MTKNVNSVAMESPVNVKKQNTRRKKMNNRPKKQIVDVTDVRYCYPKTFEDMWPKRGYIEYKMPSAMIEDVLNNRSKSEERIDPQKYLCDYVNEQYDLMGYCVRVIAG